MSWKNKTIAMKKGKTEKNRIQRVVKNGGKNEENPLLPTSVHYT